jgi:hypothetical protein
VAHLGEQIPNVLITEAGQCHVCLGEVALSATAFAYDAEIPRPEGSERRVEGVVAGGEGIIAVAGLCG